MTCTLFDGFRNYFAYNHWSPPTELTQGKNRLKVDFCNFKLLTAIGNSENRTIHAFFNIFA